MKNLFHLFDECNGVCTDTRKMESNCLFICLSGDNFNGNTFAQQALDKGAKYIIADDLSICDNNRIFYVENCLLFLQELAKNHRRKFNIPIIGITGSNGKTSTKELINTVLSKEYLTLATTGNLNNHIGVPLTLLNLNSKHEIAIIEMGANRFKDIAELCSIAEPTHGIITNIGKAHLEGFINFEGVLKTKRELYEAIEAVNGVLFYNLDDPILCDILPKGIKSFSYGNSSQATIQGELIELTPFVNLKWKNKNHSSKTILTQMIGKYNYYNFLAAICIGDFFKVPTETISEAISSYLPSNNRSQVTKTALNTLILDAYNANPTSMKSAIESFALTDHPKKIAILGDMFELGEDSPTEHKLLIDLVKLNKLKCIFIGKRFYQFHDETNEKLNFYETKQDLYEKLSKSPLKEYLILLKGSRSVGLEDLVEKL